MSRLVDDLMVLVHDPNIRLLIHPALYLHDYLVHAVRAFGNCVIRGMGVLGIIWATSEHPHGPFLRMAFSHLNAELPGGPEEVEFSVVVDLYRPTTT